MHLVKLIWWAKKHDFSKPAAIQFIDQYLKFGAERLYRDRLLFIQGDLTFVRGGGCGWI
jgi:hypothetical protein